MALFSMHGRVLATRNLAGVCFVFVVVVASLHAEKTTYLCLTQMLYMHYNF